jgi:hypothetical protein
MPLQLIKQRCPHCGRRVAVDDEEIGTEIRCPYRDCQQTIRVEPSDVEENSLSESTLKTLHPVMFRARPFVGMGLWTAVALGIAGLWWTWAGNATTGWLTTSATLIACLVFAVAAGLGLVAWWIATRCTSLRVTTERSLLRRGVLSRQSSEVRHRDVRNLQVHQSLYQRLVGVGDLSISSAGQEDMEIVIRGIPDPHAVAGTIRDQQ